MQTLIIEIQAAEGLHARPAHLFCTTASQFAAEVKVRNLTTGSKTVNAKSILLVLTLGVAQGHTIEITTSGADEEAALQGLQRLIEANFPS
jgi:phosphocarrier protein FPr